MTKKITYTDEPLGEVEVIADFLPSPAELALREEGVKASNPIPANDPSPERAVMKYVLEPDNRNCHDDVLLDDLRAVAGRLGKTSITKDDYDKHGRFAAATMQKRFGSWNKALRESGLLVAKRMAIPVEELLADLTRVAESLQTRFLSTSDYSSSGLFSVTTFQRTFGSWPEALAAVGLEPSDSWQPKAAEEDLLSNLATVWEALGRQPKKSDLWPPISHISAHSYVRRFGSWRQALEAFVSSANQSYLESNTESESIVHTLPPSPGKRSTQRDPSWRLRFLVNRRDRFTCRACGRSPATHLGVVLHIDHVVPWSMGGETVIGNLQTLCEVCNIGKSNLPMTENEG